MNGELPIGPNICARCGKRFKPEYCRTLNRWHTCCVFCRMRNTVDGLEATAAALENQNKNMQLL